MLNTKMDKDLLAQLNNVAIGLARIKGINETAPLEGEGYSLQFEEWDWEIGVGVYGLFRHAQKTNDQTLIKALVDWYDWQIERGLPPKQVNSCAPMLAMCCLLDHVEKPDWERLVCEWADWLVSGLERTQDGGFQHVTKERMNKGELWDDTLFMTCLFLARAGKRFDRKDWVDESLYQFIIHTRYLSNTKNGLWYHGWTFEGRHNFADAFWGRGNAWVTIAIPELFSILQELPLVPRRFLSNVLTSQVETLQNLQNEDGFFHTLLEDPTSPIEASATAGFAYGIARGIDVGLLPERFSDVSNKAREAVLSCIDSDGIVQHVSDGTPMGHDLDFYRKIPNIPAPYGQALTMLMLVDAIK